MKVEPTSLDEEYFGVLHDNIMNWIDGHCPESSDLNLSFRCPSFSLEPMNHHTSRSSHPRRRRRRRRRRISAKRQTNK